VPDKLTFTAGTNLPEIAEDVASGIAMITRSVSPLLVYLGFPDDLVEAENVRHEWQEDALLPNSCVVVGPLLAGATTITVTPGTGTRMRIGDVLQVDGSQELMIVTANVVANSFDVTRGIRGTTAVGIANGAVIKRMNNPAVENETAPSARPESRTRLANYTEIFRDVASVSRSAQKVKMLNVADELAYQVMKKEKDLTRDVAHTVINGRMQTTNPEGTTVQPRTMHGIIPWILDGGDPVNVDALGAGLTENLLKTAMQQCFERGGEPRALAAHPTQRKRLSSLLEGRQRYTPEDNRLGSVVERVVTDFGELDVLAPDIFIPSNVIMLLDGTKIRVAKLGSGPAWEEFDLAKTSLADSKEIVGEFTVEIKNAGDGGHGLITNLAT